MPMPLVRIVEGPGSGTTFPIVGAMLSLGRDPQNLVVIEDAKASRFHAEVACEKGKWLLRDLGSSNGTWRNDQKIASIDLAEGTEFRIGRTTLRFELGDNIRGINARTEFIEPTKVEGLKQETDLFRRRAVMLGGNTTSELARQNAYLVLLHRIVERSQTSKARDELFEVLDDTASELLEGDRCAVFLPDAARRDLGGWSLWPAHETRLKARFGAVPFARSLLAAVHERKEPLLCTLEGDLAPSQSMVQAGVRSAMAAPMRIGREMQALLYVDRVTGLSSFSRQDLEFLAAVANQMAVCLANRAEVAELKAEVARLVERPAQQLPTLIGDHIQPLVELATKAATGNMPVLITGDPGTGKDLFARLVHTASPRANRPLQVLSCVGEEAQRIERLLCGAAGDPRPGVLELAHQGTVLIEEIGDLPASAQARLLRAIVSGELQRVGDATVRPIDVRIIATSSRESAALAGPLRADLLEHLRGMVIVLPALTARGGDLEQLADHILAECARRLDQPVKRLAPETRTALLRCGWPGNVRQLKQALERATALTVDSIIRPNDLPNTLQTPVAATPAQGVFAPVPLADIERQHILRILEHCGGNKKAAAEVLEIDRSTLYAKLRQYGVH